MLLLIHSAELDGALPIQVAVDWFNGLIIPPVKYLPTNILTRENVEELIFNLNNPGEINLDYLYRLIIEYSFIEVESFFDSLYLQFSFMGVLTVECFSKYLNELRIEAAKKLLLTTNIKANKIALEVGCSDSNYFYNTFKKYTGMYPSEYLELRSNW